MEIKNITQKVSEYTNKDGEKKAEYLTVGTMLIKDDGSMSIHMKCNPRLELTDGWLNVWDRKPKENKDGSQTGPF